MTGARSSRLLPATALLLLACSAPGPSAETIAAERAAVAADAAARAASVAAAAPPPADNVQVAANQSAASGGAPTLSCPTTVEGPRGTTYRPRPLPPGRARILSVRSLAQDAGGGCNIELGYPGAEPTFVVAQNYNCEEERPQVYDVARIRELGQLDDLSAADRADIERLERIGVIGVETEFSWTVYVPDRACVVREIALAD